MLYVEMIWYQKYQYPIYHEDVRPFNYLKKTTPIYI